MAKTQIKVLLFCVSILATLTTKSVYGQCSTPPVNLAAYEGTQNTIIACNSPTKMTWILKPVTDEMGQYQLTNYDNAVPRAYANLFGVNETGLIIKTAQGSAAVPPISTAGLYRIDFMNSTNQSGAMFLVVREPPTCACATINSTRVNITCSVTYADGAHRPIDAKMTWTSNGNFYRNETPKRKLAFPYYISTSKITVDVNDSSEYQCKVTFAKPRDIQQFPYIAANAPDFSASCSSLSCGKTKTTAPSSTTTTTQVSTTTPTPTSTTTPTPTSTATTTPTSTTTNTATSITTTTPASRTTPTPTSATTITPTSATTNTPTSTTTTTPTSRTTTTPTSRTTPTPTSATTTTPKSATTNTPTSTTTPTPTSATTNTPTSTTTPTPTSTTTTTPTSTTTTTPTSTTTTTPTSTTNTGTTPTSATKPAATTSAASSGERNCIQTTVTACSSAGRNCTKLSECQSGGNYLTNLNDECVVKAELYARCDNCCPETLVCGVVVTLRNDSRWLIYDPQCDDNKCEMVVANASCMSSDWKLLAERKITKSGVGDYLQSGNNPSIDPSIKGCSESCKRMMNLP